jgi:uncharacterized protein
MHEPNKEDDGMAKYRILTIDGGGLLGVIPTVLLQRLSEHPTLAGWLGTTDLLAGTSTGGLIALGLAAGLDIKQIRDVYEIDGPKIFAHSWVDDLTTVGNLVRAKYHVANLRQALREVVGDITLGQLGKKVLITAFDLENENAADRSWKPKIFHNFEPAGGEAETDDRQQLVYKVGVYTCLTPTYWASEDGYIDGGVFAPNPSMCALAQCQDWRYKDLTPASPSEIVLLSLGTSTQPFHIEGQTPDWGYVQWAQHLIPLMLYGVTGIADYQCSRLLRERHHRLQPITPPGSSFPVDDAGKIPDMIEFAQGYPLDKTIDWLENQWK